MRSRPVTKNIEQQKLELIKLRIQNKFYDRMEVLERVVEEIYSRDIKHK